LDENLAVALRIHGYTPAVPIIRARLDRHHRTGSGAHFLTGALAALGGADEAEHLWRLLQEHAEARTSLVAGSVLWSLGRAADPRAERLLLDAVEAAPGYHLSAAVAAYLDRRGPAGMPDLVAALLLRSSWGADVTEIADTLHRYAPSAPAGPVLDAFIDPRRNPSVRWALSALLDAHPETWPRLRTLLGRPGTGRLAAAASAAVLGRQEHPYARDPLRRALPALINQRGLSARPLALRRVVAALSALDDDEWAQRVLLSHIHARLDAGPPRAGTWALLTALADTRLEPITDDVADLVVRLVMDPPADLDDWFWTVDGSPLAAVPPVASRLRDLVGSGRLTSEQTSRILYLLPAAAPDPSLVPRVLPLLSDRLVRRSIPTARPSWTDLLPMHDPAFDILVAIARRHHVRIFADGRIVPFRP
jgi:hypothetical protein